MPTELSTIPEMDAWSICTRCSLSNYRDRIVLGAGNPKAEIMFVGGHPRHVENETGVPWSGAGGQDLRSMMANHSINTGACFFDYVISCIPRTVTEEGEVLDADPTPNQIACCRPRLLEAIYRIDPILLVALGAVAARALLGTTRSIQDLRGDIHLSEVPGVKTHIKYPTLVTYDPTVLRTKTGRPAMTESGDESEGGDYKKKEGVWSRFGDDLERARHRIDELKHIAKR